VGTERPHGSLVLVGFTVQTSRPHTCLVNPVMKCHGQVSSLRGERVGGNNVLWPIEGP
jgi:hypothetical protein